MNTELTKLEAGPEMTSKKGGRKKRITEKQRRLKEDEERRSLQQIDWDICENLFGWKWTAYGNGGGHWDGEGADKFHFTPRFTTEIAQAWKVVEKMKLLGYSFGAWDCLSLSSVPHPGVAFAQSVYPPTMENNRGGIISCGGTIPLCICRAALQVVERMK